MKVIKYHTGDTLDFSEELDKIWWDYLDSSYEVSMVNVDVLDNPIIRNAYSYQVVDDRVYYSIISDTSLKKKVHEMYDKIIHGNNISDFKIIDKYTYSVKKYNNVSPSFEIAEEIIRQLDIFKSYPIIQRVDMRTLDEHIFKIISYIVDNDIYSDDWKVLESFYVNNRERILSLQSFSQGNCSFDRILTNGSNYFFDYFSIYERVAYGSYAWDYGQLLVDIVSMDVPEIQKYKKVNEYLKREDADIILFFSLLQEEAFNSKSKKFLLTKFKNIIKN